MEHIAQLYTKVKTRNNFKNEKNKCEEMKKKVRFRLESQNSSMFKIIPERRRRRVVQIDRVCSSTGFENITQFYKKTKYRKAIFTR